MLGGFLGEFERERGGELFFSLPLKLPISPKEEQISGERLIACSSNDANQANQDQQPTGAR